MLLDFQTKKQNFILSPAFMNNSYSKKKLENPSPDNVVLEEAGVAS